MRLALVLRRFAALLVAIAIAAPWWSLRDAVAEPVDDPGGGAVAAPTPGESMPSSDFTSSRPDAGSLRDLEAKARERGTIRVIATLRMRFTPEGGLSDAEVTDQRATIARHRSQVTARVARAGARETARFETVPLAAFEVNARALRELGAAAEVAAIEEDELAKPTLADSIPLIGGDAAQASNLNGLGQTVAILDTGVAKTHPFFSDGAGGTRVVSEACYSGNSNCPNGTTEQTGSGSGVNCTYAPSGCRHGTHVAGIAAGANASMSGVAPRANIIAIQVFSRFTGAVNCNSEDPCTLSYTSDQIKGLERVYALRTTYSIASANMSLGGDLFSSTCDTDSRKTIIDNLRSAGIATAIASGNDGSTYRTSKPGCISTAVTVGSTTKADAISSFSNSASWVDLLAPGSDIESSIPGGYAFFNGTSMATPHVAGAWAVLRQLRPSDSVTTLTTRLQSDGLAVTDTRVAGGQTKRRIRLFASIQALDTVANSDFAAASVLSGQSGNANGTNVGATKELGEPAHGGNSGGASIWYRWTPPVGGPAKIMLRGSAFDTTLGVYTGSAVNALAVVAQNDDANATTQSQVSFTATAGTTYRIAVDGYRSGTSPRPHQGAVTLAYTVSQPGNDDFAGIGYSGATGTIIGTNRGATSQPGEPGPFPTKSIWYTWTPTASGRAVLSTASSTFDTVVDVYTGGTVDALTLVGSDDDSGPGTSSLVAFTAVAGTPYRIRIRGFSGADGDLTLTRGIGTPSIRVGNAVATEGGAPTSMSIPVTLSGPTTEIVTIGIETRDGTAVAGSDYTAQYTTLTYQPGETFKTLVVPVLPDVAIETTERFGVYVLTMSGATLADGEGIGTIADDDAGFFASAPVSVYVSDPTVVEGADGMTTDVTFEVSLSRPLRYAELIAVQVSTLTETAFAPSDFAAVGIRSLQFTPATGPVHLVTTTVVGDDRAEPDETFALAVSRVPVGTFLADGRGTATILDDDGVVPVRVSDVFVTEGETARFGITVGRRPAPGEWVQVAVAAAAGSATSGDDFTPLTMTMTFTDTTPLRIEAPVSVSADARHEGTESFRLEITSLSSNARAADGTGVATVADDEGPLSITVDDVSIAEDPAGSSSTASVPVRLNAPPGPGEVVTVTLATAPGTATAPSDFTALPPTTLTFTEASGATQTVEVSVVGDAFHERDETFTVALSAPTNAVLGDSSGTIRIADEEGPLSLYVSDGSAVESVTGERTPMPFSVWVTPTPAPGEVVSVVAMTSTGTALAGDFTPVTLQTLTLDAATPARTITVSVTGDGIAEPTETFSLLAMATDTSSVVADGTGTGRILDDDGGAGVLDAPISISVSDVAVLEGATGVNTPAQFTVSLSRPLVGAETVSVTAATASSTAGTGDYTALPPTTLTFTSAAQSRNVTVNVKGDSRHEPTEQLLLNLSAPSANSVLADTSGTGFILDEEQPLAVAVSDVTILEGDTATSAVFTLRLNAAPSGDVVSVVARSTAMSATTPADFGTVSSTVVFTTATGPVQTVTVPVTGDVLHEGDERFALLLSTPTNLVLADTSAEALVVDDEGILRVGIDDRSVLEGPPGTSRTVSVPVTVSELPAAGETVVATVGLGTGTAGAGPDFDSFAPVAVTFTSATPLTQYVTVRVRGDGLHEADEHIALTLTATGPAAPADESARIDILDDEGFLRVFVDNAVAKEGPAGVATSMTFTVRLSSPPVTGESATFTVGTAGSSAMSPADYTAVSQSLTFAPGVSSRQVVVPIAGDATFEGQWETFSLNASGLPGHVVAGDSSGTGIIVDDD